MHFDRFSGAALVGAALFALAVVLLGGCGSSAGARGPAPVPGRLVESSAARVTAPAPAGDVAARVAGDTAFALDVYRAVAAGSDGNLALSPASLSFALGMTWAGAAGDTAAAFGATLHAGIPEDRWHRAANDLLRQLAARGAGAKGADGGPFRLVILDQLFGQDGASFEQPFLDTLAAEYGAGLRVLDFQADPEPPRRAIDAWVSDATAGLVPDLLPAGSLSRDTRLVLVNTVFFDAAWATPFEPRHEGAFTRLDGQAIAAPAMSQEVAARTAEVDGVQVVDLPYDGRDTSMLLLVPPAGGLAAFEQALTAERLQALASALADDTVELTLPPFAVRTPTALSGVLSSLGLGVAFSDAADFSRMSRGPPPLMLAEVYHQAVVQVTEAGTIAAAGTGAVAVPTSAPSHRVVVDRPFLYAIRDRVTGAVLFLGRVVDPTAP